MHSGHNARLPVAQVSGPNQLGLIALGWWYDSRFSQSRDNCGFGCTHWKCFCCCSWVTLIHKTLSAVVIGALLFSLPVPLVVAASPDVMCEFTDTRLNEISGMAPSQVHPGVMWVHNDSGDEARLYALRLSDCAVVGELTLRDVSARDFEGLASGVDAQGRPVLWVGDIGDNVDSWSDVSIYRIREPRNLGNRSAQVQRYRFTYEDRPHNAETILADPNSQQLWIVTKQMASGSVYKLPKKLKKGEVNIAKKVGPASGLITDGAVKPDGSGFVLRDYFDAQFYAGLPTGELAEEIQLPAQAQGEAIAWLPGEDALLIASEGDNRLLRVEAPGIPVAAENQGGISGTSEGSVNSAPEIVVAERGPNYTVLVGVVVSVIVLVTGLIRIRKKPASKATGSTKNAV